MQQTFHLQNILIGVDWSGLIKLAVNAASDCDQLIEVSEFLSHQLNRIYIRPAIFSVKTKQTARVPRGTSKPGRGLFLAAPAWNL